MNRRSLAAQSSLTYTAASLHDQDHSGTPATVGVYRRRDARDKPGQDGDRLWLSVQGALRQDHCGHTQLEHLDTAPNVWYEPETPAGWQFPN